MKTRREFLTNGMLAAAGASLAGCATGGAAKAPALAGDFAWGALLHLGSNMWRDWVPGEAYPTSAEEEARMVREGKIEFKSSRLYCTRDYMSTDWNSWRAQVDCIRSEGLNMVFIDIGEAYAYPSRPELWVKGSLGFEELRAELGRIRGLGLEPIPKLNFSTGHDIWLKQYHYQTSTPRYYAVVADVIRDVCEVFDRPRYFHIGFDEETPAAVKGRALAVIRQGDLWWHDFFHCVREVERHGSRAMMWADGVCAGRETYLKRMSKGVLQQPWYYGTDFSDAKVTWDASFEKKTDWSVQRNLAASIGVLADAGFDVLPCTSNWSSDAASAAMISYCKKRVDPARLRGFMSAPWFMTHERVRTKLMDGIRIFAEAKRSCGC